MYAYLKANKEVLRARTLVALLDPYEMGLFEHSEAVVEVAGKAITKQGQHDAANVLVAAWLHDVPEDTDIDADRLLLGFHFSREVVDAVRLLTREPSLPYGAYIARIAASRNYIARMVKVADLLVNIAREGRPDLKPRYQDALGTLLFFGLS